MTIDQRGRAAADDLHREVATTTDPTEALATVVATRPRRRRVPLVAAAAVVAILALMGTLVALNDDDGSGVDVTVDDADRTTPEPDATPGPQTGVAGPTDGKDSLLLPVTVEPSTDLVPGDVVTVTATGFNPGEAVGIVLCAYDPVTGEMVGANACELGTVTAAVPDADGDVVGTFTMTRRIETGQTGPYDCGAAGAACAIAVGQISDYDISGFTAVSFRSDLPELADPEVVVDRTEGLRHGDEITVTGTGVGGSITGWVQQCGEETADGEVLDTPVCTSSRIEEAARSGEQGLTGRFSMTLPVWRVYPAGPEGSIDCATTACFLLVDIEGLAADPVALSFDLDEPLPPPTLTVTATGGEVTVTVEGLPAGQTTRALLCAGDDCLPEDVLGDLRADAQGRAEGTFALPDRLGDDCTTPGTCAVVLGVAGAGEGEQTIPFLMPDAEPFTMS